MYSDEEIENFRCIFDMFDKDKSGFIDVGDLETVMRSLGRDPSEAKGLLDGLDLNSDGRLSFEEFLKIMKSLENMLVATKEGEGEEI
jgi:calmodulin